MKVGVKCTIRTTHTEWSPQECAWFNCNSDISQREVK